MLAQEIRITFCLRDHLLIKDKKVLTPMTVAAIPGKIAAEINAQENQIKAAMELLDGGATVPFIARYRKEVTGGLDDAQLRTLETRLTYLQ